MSLEGEVMSTVLICKLSLQLGILVKIPWSRSIDPPFSESQVWHMQRGILKGEEDNRAVNSASGRLVALENGLLLANGHGCRSVTKVPPPEQGQGPGYQLSEMGMDPQGFGPAQRRGAHLLQHH